MKATHCGSPYQVKGTLAEAFIRLKRLNLSHDQIDQLRGSSNGLCLITRDNDAEPRLKSQDQFFSVGPFCETLTKILEPCYVRLFGRLLIHVRHDTPGQLHRPDSIVV